MHFAAMIRTHDSLNTRHSNHSYTYGQQQNNCRTLHIRATKTKLTPNMIMNTRISRLFWKTTREMSLQCDRYHENRCPEKSHQSL